MLASGGMDDLIFLWDARTGKQVGAPLKGHKKWITSISWEPYHMYDAATLVFSMLMIFFFIVTHHARDLYLHLRMELPEFGTYRRNDVK